MNVERTGAEVVRGRFLGLTLIAIAVLPFLPTLAGGWFWDDYVNIERNPTLRDPRGWWRIWTEPTASFQYYPITYSAFWLQFRAFGDRPAWFHVVNLILHAVNALLIWGLLRRLKLPWPWFAAALWAGHPMQVETVGWISEQKNLLSTLFALLALNDWVDGERTGRRASAVRATIWFAAALLSKTVVLALVPFLLFRSAIVRGPHRGMQLAALLVWLAMSVGMGAVTVWRETATSKPTGSPADTPPRLTSAERTTQAGANLVHYLHTFVWPHPLAPIMPRSSAAKNFAPTICLAVVAFVLAWFAWRGCSGPLLAAAFATAMLGPTLGFAPFQFQCHADVADHFAYFPILGLSVFVAGACGWLERQGWTAGVRMANVVLLGGLLAVSSAYSRVFADPEVVWRHTLAVNPKAWSAAINLGSYLLERGRDSEAAAVLEQGLAVRPEAPDLHVNLGLAYAKLARHADAERHIRQALALGQERADLWRGLGNASAQQQKWPEAERAFRRALKLSPEDSAARFGLAAVLATVGRKAEALRELDLLLQTDPNHAEARAARKRLQALK